MSDPTSPAVAEPVGHQGARVQISEGAAIAVNGWLGVLLLAGGVVAMVFAAQHDNAVIWLPLVVSVLVITSLVIVPPGQTSVVQFFRPLRRHGASSRVLVGLAAHGASPGQRPGP